MLSDSFYKFPASRDFARVDEFTWAAFLAVDGFGPVEISIPFAFKLGKGLLFVWLEALRADLVHFAAHERFRVEFDVCTVAS